MTGPDADHQRTDRHGGPRHRVVFAPAGLSTEVDDGTTILDAARQAGADLDSTCGGRGRCGRCQVIPTVGTFAKHGITSSTESVSDRSTTEDAYSGRRPLDGDHRLGCSALVHGDLVVEVPEASQVHRQVVRKDVDLGGIEVDPTVTLHYVELPPADLDGDDGGLAEQIGTALVRDFGFAVDGVAPDLLPSLDRVATTGGGTLTVAVRRRAPSGDVGHAGDDGGDRHHDGDGDGSSTIAGTVDAVFAGFVDRAFGAAFDVGSTTIASHLVDLLTGEVVATAGRMNPQIRFGDDLMSRVSYVMMNPGGEVELTSAVRRALDELVDDLLDGLADDGVDRSRILDLVIVGNPIMHHLVLGIDPTPLRQAPFRLATDRPVDTTASAIGLDLPHAAVHLLPCVAGHVGADTTAAVLAEGPHRDDETQLLVDVGTNAEIVLGDRRRLLAASSPTGPAFEGAQISAGMRATVGAIERVRIDRSTLKPRMRVIGSDVWSDDPGFAGRLESVGTVAGLCGSGIIEVVSEMYLSGIVSVDGTIRPVPGIDSDRVVATGDTFAYVVHRDPATGDEIRVTQEDVRAIQLAKAALRAGIDLLVERAGIDVDSIGSVRLAGAFGAHIDPLHAKVLGLVPDVPVDRVRAVGNAAGAGAVRALVSASQRSEIAAVARRIEKVETALEPRFQELFVAAMGFPHTSTATPNLAGETELPARPAAETTGRRRGGARGRRPR